MAGQFGTPFLKGPQKSSAGHVQDHAFFECAACPASTLDGVVVLGAGQREARETMELLKTLPVDVYHELLQAVLD